MGIEQIQRLCKQNALEVTHHAQKRLEQRNILPEQVQQAILVGEIIEEYPDDYPYPSCLILGNGLHMVIATTENMLYLVTAYAPNVIRWDDTFKLRKERN